jgi:hypothetical protein
MALVVEFRPLQIKPVHELKAKSVSQARKILKLHTNKTLHNKATPVTIDAPTRLFLL